MIDQIKNIRARINKIWPDLEFIVFTDPIFYRPSLSDVRDLLLTTKIDQEKHIRNFRACEEFALKLLLASRERAEGFPHNWALGFVYGQSFKHVHGRHYCNIVDAQEGIFIIEPQTDEIREPSNGQDQINFMLM